MLRRSAALARSARPAARLSQQQASSTPAAAAAARPFSTQTSKNHETWRGDNDDDALPKVKRRDGSVEVIGNVRGFVDYERNPEPYRAPMERVTDWEEINSEGHDPVERIVQAARCMDCGTPFCQTHTGCPVNNLIPEFNALVYQDQWRNALDRLHQTNNFPEFTGRVCPAPCEEACTLNLEDIPVAIKTVEQAIADKAYASSFVTPQPAVSKTGKKVAAKTGKSKKPADVDADGDETISFEGIANRLGSNFDPAAKLFDSTGRLLGTFGDSPGIAPDLQFRFRFEKTGRYFLRLRDMAYAGGRGSFFRLRVGDFPIVSGVYPQGNRRGELKPFYPIAEPPLPPVLATPAGSGFWLNFKSQNGVGRAYRRLATSATVNVYETEPNDDRAKAAVFNMPAVLNGRFAQPDDRDWFAVTLAKAEGLDAHALSVAVRLDS